MMPPQLGRGERRNYKRPLFEELVCLDARWLARQKLIPKDWSTRRYDFLFRHPAYCSADAHQPLRQNPDPRRSRANTRNSLATQWRYWLWLNSSNAHLPMRLWRIPP